MPKRECPFDYDLIPQSKVHIGEKEVNCGAMEVTNMKTVYEKTLSLLFEGAKNIPFVRANVSEIPESSNEGKLYKQMFLKNNCQLQTSGVLLSQPLSECDICKIAIKLTASTSCDFCDRRLCYNCMFVCVKCSDNFCCNCILKMYSGSGDNQMCISCVQ